MGFASLSLTNNFLPDFDLGKLVTLKETQSLCRLSDEVILPYFFFYDFLVTPFSASFLGVVLFILLIEKEFSFCSLRRTCLESMPGNWLRKIFQWHLEYLNLAQEQCKTHFSHFKYSLILRDQDKSLWVFINGRVFLAC